MPTAVYNRTNRIAMIDGLRGISIVYVVMYHLLYDIQSIFGVHFPFWGTVWFEGIHTAFLILLIGISGISTGFSRNIFRRGAVVLVLGFCISAVTMIFMPPMRIVFGVLSFFGSAMLLYGVCKPFFDKIPWFILLPICIILYIIFIDMPWTGKIHLFFTDLTVPDSLREMRYLYPIGIKSSDFYSTDYFPLIPWFFIFLCGTAISPLVKDEKLPKFFYRQKMPFFDFIGKYTLQIYVVHQPIIYGLTLISYKIWSKING